MTAPDYQTLLDNNRAWVGACLERDPGYFEKLAEGQEPGFLLVGCSDSRKPLDTITQTDPGELFIHRNVANQVAPDDLNVQSVLDFAIGSLGVNHVIVCGHTNCGGVKAVLDGTARGAVRRWLSRLSDLRDSLRDELAAAGDAAARAELLAIRNVVAQVESVASSRAYQAARAEGTAPALHGWLFRIETGVIEELELPLERWRRGGLLD